MVWFEMCESAMAHRAIGCWDMWMCIGCLKHWCEEDVLELYLMLSSDFGGVCWGWVDGWRCASERL